MRLIFRHAITSILGQILLGKIRSPSSAKYGLNSTNTVVTSRWLWHPITNEDLYVIEQWNLIIIYDCEIKLQTFCCLLIYWLDFFLSFSVYFLLSVFLVCVIPFRSFVLSFLFFEKNMGHKWVVSLSIYVWLGFFIYWLGCVRLLLLITECCVLHNLVVHIFGQFFFILYKFFTAFVDGFPLESK